MSALVIHMRRVIGEEAANATVARNLLADVAGKLPGGGGDDLHRRCVLFDCAPSRVRVDDVRAALAPSGGGAEDAIEAVALCGYLVAAVVVFRTAAAAEGALLRRSCHAVPPLDLDIEIPFIGPTDVKIMPHSPPPEPCTPPPPPEEEQAEPLPLPLIEFLGHPVEASGPGLPPGAKKQFHPSCESLVHGPTRGDDGSLWMHGDVTTTDKRGRLISTRIGGASIRVRRTDPPPPDQRRPGIPDTAIWFEPLEPKIELWGKMM